MSTVFAASSSINDHTTLLHKATVKAVEIWSVGNSGNGAELH